VSKFCSAWRARAPRLSRRRAAVFGCSLALLSFLTNQAFAQELQLLRDTETERLLKSYEDPLAKADGLDPQAIHLYLVNDNSVNAFVAEGQNMFIQTGMIMFAKTPNELIGVMAHESGHIKAGHLSRGAQAMSKAEIPMILSMIVGLAAMAMGAGEAGMAVMMAGQQIAEGQFMAFSRIQEATADQIALKALAATHQSPEGLLHTFQRFAAEEAMAAYRPDPWILSHPVGQDRVALLETEVDASPYKDVKDSPQATHAFLMMQAKLEGYVLPTRNVFNRFPLTDTSEQARYARAMAYSRLPDFKKALTEIDSLIKDEPRNPYFYEVLGQIYVNMAKPELGIPAFQKSVDLLPDAPQLRVGLAAAELATEQAAEAKPALGNLKRASLIENDDPFTWYLTAQAYSDLNNQPMADLSTAEQMYAIGAYDKAALFARRAQRGLTQGTIDWLRAGDIMASASIGKKASER